MTGQIQIDFLNLNIYPHTHIPLHPLLRYIHKEEQIKKWWRWSWQVEIHDVNLPNSLLLSLFSSPPYHIEGMNKDFKKRSLGRYRDKHMHTQEKVVWSVTLRCKCKKRRKRGRKRWVEARYKVEVLELPASVLTFNQTLSDPYFDVGKAWLKIEKKKYFVKNNHE